MLKYLPFLVAIAFVIYCAFDVPGHDARTRRGLPTWVWLLIVLLLPVVGGVVWLVVSRWAQHAGTAAPQARGPLAPDDDPDFLFRLDQERRRREPRDGTGPSSQDRPHDPPHDGGTEGPGTTDATDGCQSPE